jgi:hypothetical protein
MRALGTKYEGTPQGPRLQGSSSRLRLREESSGRAVCDPAA